MYAILARTYDFAVGDVTSHSLRAPAAGPRLDGKETPGALVPLDVLPSGVAIAFGLLPTTWFVDAIHALTDGAEPTMPLFLCWALMGATTAAMAFTAIRLHRWS